MKDFFEWGMEICFAKCIFINSNRRNNNFGRYIFQYEAKHNNNNNKYLLNRTCTM